jgi:hypothetical protein
LTAALIGGLFAVPAMAAPKKVAIHTLQLVSGPTQFAVEYALLVNGVKQITYFMHEPRLMRDTWLQVLVGRDLDMDGNFETWFPLTSEKYPTFIRKISTAEDGWDGAQSVLLNDADLNARPLTEVFAHWAPRAVGGFAADTYRDNIHETFYHELGLLSTEAQIKRGLETGSLSRPAATAALQQIVIEWQGLGREIHDNINEYLASLAKDAALYSVIRAISIANRAFGFGKYIARQVKGGASVAVQPLLRTQWGAYLADYLGRTSQSYTLHSRHVMNTISRFSVPVVHSSASAIALARGITQVGRNGLAQISQKLLVRDVVGRFLLEIWREKFYVTGASVLIQVPVELGFRKWNGQSFSETLSDEDFLTNVMFMFLETTIQTGIIGVNKNAAFIPKMSYVAAGSMVNSMTVGAAVRNSEPDPGEKFMNMGWECFVGGAQTLLDLKTKQKFVYLPLASGRAPKRGIWIAQVVANQALGYTGFYFLTEWYRKSDRNSWVDMKAWFQELFHIGRPVVDHLGDMKVTVTPRSGAVLTPPPLPELAPQPPTE